MASVTHEFDPACPYCRTAEDIQKQMRERAERAEQMQGRRGVVPGSTKPFIQFQADEPKLPEWVNPAIQDEGTKRAIERAKEVQHGN